MTRPIPQRKLSRPDVWMTQGPTFEKLCALVVWAFGHDTNPERVRVHFEDLDGPPPDGVPDIDVRAHYPQGSSAFEQTVRALCPDAEAELAALAGTLNQNNATGFLKARSYRRWSFVRLIRAAYDMRDPRACALKAWRQRTIKRFLPVAETVVLFHLCAHIDTEEARATFAANWPGIVRMGPSSPFTLPGYAYARWLLWPHDFERFLLQDFRFWRRQFSEAFLVRDRRVRALREDRLPLYVCPSTGLRLLCLDVETDQDAAAAFEVYPDADVVVARDARPRDPRVAILPRESRPIMREMHAIHMALAKAEPDSWYAMPRESGFSWLLNGSTSRAAKVPSDLARREARIMGAILIALDDWHARQLAQTDP